MHWWGWHVLHWSWWRHAWDWFNTDRLVALGALTAAITSIFATARAGQQSRNALRQAQETSRLALAQAAEQSAAALDQARATARDDRRSQHQILIYDRVVQLREEGSQWYYTLGSCRGAGLA